MTKSPRPDGRQSDELRSAVLRPHINPYAEGSVEVCFGKTKVHVTASVLRETPRWLGEGNGGWVTAEYGMLPRSTHTRSRREAATGKQGGRTLEIQRLIGRALRAAVDLKALEGITIQLDCDVLVADGGTRTAAITGGWVALALALQTAAGQGLVPTGLPLKQIAAVSVGRVDGESVLDLCYEEDSQAELDLNIVANDAGELIEIQGTAERGGLARRDLDRLLDLALAGIDELLDFQRRALVGRSAHED